MKNTMKRENQLSIQLSFILRNRMEESHTTVLIGFFKAQSVTLKLYILHIYKIHNYMYDKIIYLYNITFYITYM